MRSKFSAYQSGVTLMELVIVIVTLSILIAPIASGYNIIGQGFGLNREIQMSAAFAQECAEHVLQLARNGSYAAIDTTTCDTDLPPIPALPEFSTLDVDLSVNTIVGPTASCPSNCKEILVSAMANGKNRSTIEFILVN